MFSFHYMQIKLTSDLSCKRLCCWTSHPENKPMCWASWNLLEASTGKQKLILFCLSCSSESGCIFLWRRAAPQSCSFQLRKKENGCFSVKETQNKHTRFWCLQSDFCARCRTMYSKLFSFLFAGASDDWIWQEWVQSNILVRQLSYV